MNQTSLTKEELLAKFDEAYQLGIKHGRAESADLIEWAETLLSNSMPLPGSGSNRVKWPFKVNEWREAKNALPPHDRLTTAPRFSPPSPQTAQIREWMADLDALLFRVDASRDYPYRRGDMIDCRASAVIHLHEARHWLIADLGHQRKQASTCDHAAYLALPQPRPRHCPTCDTCMWDAGD